jgi:glycosyltransferase involved in cell wall biosynthesis
MLSVVIPTENAERALVPTLTALVPGATAGVVREVIVADAGSSDATALIADAAGCRIDVAQVPLGQRLRQAAAGARATWLLFLRPGAVPDWTWVDETRRFIEEAETCGRVDARAAAFRRTQDAETLGSAILEGLALFAAKFGGQPRPQQGLLISKTLYESLGGHLDGDADPEGKLLRRLGRRRVVMLRCRAMMAAAAQ